MARALAAGSAYVPVIPSMVGFQKQVASQIGAQSAGMAAAGRKAGTGYGRGIATGAGASLAPGLKKATGGASSSVNRSMTAAGRKAGTGMGAAAASSAGATMGPRLKKSMGRATGGVRSAMSATGASAGTALAASAGTAAGRSTAIGAGLATAAKKTAKGGLLAAGVAAGMTVVSGFKSAMNQQDAETVLGGLYGSAKTAKTTLEGLRKATKSSPIEYSAYTKAAQSLAYAGVEGKKSTKILRNVGLVMAAAGGGSEEMGRATDAILKMVNNGGKAQLDTLNQLSETGVPVFDALSKKFGKGSDEIRKMASAGKIDVSDVLSVIENKTGKYMKSMTKAGGAAEKTFGNTFKAVKDDVTTSIGQALVPLLVKATPLLQRMGVWLQGAIPTGMKAIGTAASAAAPYFKILAAVMKIAFTAALAMLRPLLGLLRTLSPVILAAVAAFVSYKVTVMAVTAAQKIYAVWQARSLLTTKAMTIAQRALNLAMRLNPIGLVVSALVALGVGMVIAYKKSETFRRIVQAAWNGIKTAASAVVNWFTNTAWPFLRNVFGWIGARATWLYRNAIAPAFRGIRAVVSAVVNFFRATVWPVLSAVFGWIGRRVGWLYRSAFKVYFTLIKTVIRAVVWWFRDVVWPVFRNVFGWIAARAKWLYTNGIRPAFSWIRALATSLYRFFRTYVWGSMKATFGFIASRAKWLYTNGIRPAFNWITDKIGKVYRWFRDTVAASFSRTLGGIRDAFSRARDKIGDIWDGIKRLMAKPINAVIGFVNSPLISGINKLLPKKLEIGELKKISGYDRGGWTGPGSKMTPAGVVHADEFVVRKSSRREVERAQPGFLDALNRHGARALGYATGGRVGSYYGEAPGYAKGGRVGGHTWPLIWSYIQSKFPGDVRMTSNYRPGARAAAGPVSSHALGTAVDIGGSVGNIKKVMRHMASNYGKNMRDLIYSPLWGSRMIYQGKWIKAPAVTQRTHYDHGHIGLMPGRNLSGGAASGSGGGFDLMGPFTSKIKGLVDKFSGSPLSRAPVEFVKSKISGISSWVTDKLGAVIDTLKPGMSGGIKNAIPEAQRYLLIKQALAHVGLDPNNAAYQKATYNRAMKESGWDAGITQKVRDINSRRGDPAVGLMQIIGSTFRAYRDPRLPNDRRNPLASLVAAMRYAMAKYGSITAGFNRRGGYADGGLVKPIPGYARGGVTKPGLSWVGERGPELMYTPGGSRVYSNTESKQISGRGDIHITINGVDTDSADDVVKALRYEMTRNGRYVGV